MNEVPTPAGLMLIDKPTGPTSMDVCARVRWKLRQAGAPKRIKVGHGGTLDPMATGLLVIMVGKATKLCDKVMVGEKEYLATIDLVHRSTTDDAEGQITPIEVPTPPTEEALRDVLAKFVGVIMQVPPSFSALHVEGRRAYDLAREGKVVELAARPVTVHAITLEKFEWPLAHVRISCGKGTYIRSIARDVGSSLGVGGMLTALRRTRVGEWHVRDAAAMDALPRALTQQDLLPMPLP
jgi:tRNA pseudouridine55 synthase